MEKAAGLLAVIQTSPITLLLLVVIVIWAMISVRKGSISFHGRGLDIGKSKEEERLIISDMWELIKTTCEGVKFPSELNLSPDKTKYITAKVADIYEKAVVMNHMSTDATYLNLKKTLVLNTIRKRTTNEYFNSDEFANFIEDFNKKLITDLIAIRKFREQ